MITRQECHDVPVEDCHQVPRQDCHDVPQQVKTNTDNFWGDNPTELSPGLSSLCGEQVQRGPGQEVCGRACDPAEERVPQSGQAEVLQQREVSLQPRHHPALPPCPGRGLSGEPGVLASAETNPNWDLWQHQEGGLSGGGPDLLSLSQLQALSGPDCDQVWGQARPASVLQDTQSALSEDPGQEVFSTAQDKVQLRWKMMIMMETPGCVLQLPQEFWITNSRVQRSNYTSTWNLLKQIPLNI